MPRTYLDFDLLIEPAAEAYRARVLDSPTGQAAADFALPYSSLEMENFLLRVTRSLGEARRHVRALESQDRELVKGFGGQLFEAMFSGPVLGALQSSLNEAFRKDTGLRIRLRLTDAPELADVPWEFLFNPSANRFLSLSPDTPLVRYVDLPIPARPLAVTPPLRVLVMISSPKGLPQLDVAAEWDRLNTSVGELVKKGLVTITRLPNASLGGLQRPLRLHEYHILHFIGHGGFDNQSQSGALALEDAQGRARLVSGQDLGVMLSGHHSLRLIVLNACEGARSSVADPFAGVAQSLVQQGVPAVIAMQFEITDEAAITFATELYGAIADGYPVDAALAESRRAIFASGNDVEWATPVLYMRSPNGQLFRVTHRPGAERDGTERLAREQAERDETERLAREQAERDETGRVAREQAEPQVEPRLVNKRASRRAVGALALLAGVMLVAGYFLPFSVEGGYQQTARPLVAIDQVAAFIAAFVCGLALLSDVNIDSFLLGGVLFGAGLEQFGVRSSVLIALVELPDKSPLAGPFVSCAGALMLVAGAWIFLLRNHSQPSRRSPRFDELSKAAAALGCLVFVLAGFTHDAYSFTNLPGFAIPTALTTLMVASLAFVPSRRLPTLARSSVMLAYGGLLAVAFTSQESFAFVYYVDRGIGLVLRAVAGVLLGTAAVIAFRAARPPLQSTT